MRRHFGLLVAGLMAFAIAAPAQAGVLDPGASSFELKIGALPSIVLATAGGPEGASLANDGTVTVNAGIWQTISFSPGSALFTGVPLIDNLIVTVTNGAGTFAPSFTAGNPIGPGTLSGGGVAAISGQSVIIVGPTGIPIGLGIVGQGGTATATALGAPVTVTGAVWATNQFQVTGLASNVVTITNGGRNGVQGVAFTLEPTLNENTVQATFMFKMNTFAITQTNVFMEGTRNTSVSSMGAQVGTVTLISPIRIITGLGFLLPGSAKQILTFVPEPGTLLLLGAGVGGLLIVGRRRMR